MKHLVTAQMENVIIRPLEKSDIELLRQWRNSKEISKYLTPVPYISIGMQDEWYNTYLMDSNILMFAVEETCILKHMVGTIAIYGFNQHTAEIGKIVIGDSDAHGKRIGYKAVLLVVLYGFQYLNIQKFKLNVHECNDAAKKIYTAVGFEVVGKHPFVNGGNELEMELDKVHFVDTQCEPVNIICGETSEA